MSLGRREARHQTSAAAKVAGVEPSADWDFQPGQRVQTVDGLAGRVTAVQDGPVRGAEGYEVTLDDGMGGGLYTSSQLAPAPETVASLQETAAQDYPELEEVLHSRPDIARNTVLGSLKEAKAPYWEFEHIEDEDPEPDLEDPSVDFRPKKTAINDAEMSQASSEMANNSRHWSEPEPDTSCDSCGHEFNYAESEQDKCPKCMSSRLFDLHEDHDDHDDYHSQGGGHEDNYGDPYGKMDAYHDMKNSSLHTAADGDFDDDGDDGYGNQVYCTDCHDFHGEDRHKGSASPAKDYDGVDTSVGGDTLSNGMSSSSDSASNSVTSSLDIFDPFDLLVTASTDPEFRFEVTAAWSDVRRKAKRIRTTGGVNVTMVTEGMIFAEIKGDHNVYETGLQKLPGKMSVQGWSCGCKWGAYHWGADDDFSRFAGRMCSHALALQFEAQARGMFGRNVEPDMDKPSWVPRRIVVKYDIDADKNRSATPTYPDYGRVAGLSALSVLSSYAKAEGFTPEDFAVECVLAGITAAVNSPWGEPQADVPEVTGPTRPSHATDNPASTGWASAPDPQSWNTAITPDTIGMAASKACSRTKADYAASEADDDCRECGKKVSSHSGEYSGGEYGESNTYQASLDEFLFEAGGGPTGTGGSMMPAAGPESTLNDEPEAALPQTDGELDLGSGLPLSNGSPDGGSLGAGSVNIKGDPKSLESDTPSIMTMGGVEDIVASFQQKAAHLNPEGSGGGDSEIASAAKEFLAKEAVKDFTPGEQATIINEGQGVTAANLDRLDIAGTHYEPLEAALAARDAEEDDDAWMA
jgi:hypothetical protein